MTSSYFHSSGYGPDIMVPSCNGGEVSLSSLPAFLRTLMVADGTVTKSLEAFFWEKVRINPVINEYQTISSPIENLNWNEETRLLQREVFLKGVTSNTIYASARSLVITNQLPQDMIKGLESGQIGIGELLSIQGCETYRDIMDINHFTSEFEEDSLVMQLEGEVISRSYRISLGHAPVILVTEFFPISVYK